MDWKKFLESLKLADIQASLETDQFGFFNIKVENNTFVFNFPNAEAVKIFKQTTITPEIETQAKEDANKRLENVGTSLQSVSDSTAKEMIIGTSVWSVIDSIGKKKPDD